MWEADRHFATQSEAYKDVWAELQKAIDDASNIQDGEAIEGVANGDIGRFPSLDIENQPG